MRLPSYCAASLWPIEQVIMALIVLSRKDLGMSGIDASSSSKYATICATQRPRMHGTRQAMGGQLRGANFKEAIVVGGIQG